MTKSDIYKMYKMLFVNLFVLKMANLSKTEVFLVKYLKEGCNSVLLHSDFL